MSKQECGRSWEAEALEDGRLTEEDRMSFERHARTCSTCSAEQRALRRLHAAAGRLPIAAASDLRRKQLRLALLGSVARDGDRRRRARPAGFAILLLAVLGAVGWLFWPRHPAAPPQNAAEQLASFDVADVRGGEWTTATDGSTTRIALRAKTTAFHVRPLTQPARFLVALPDGEIEVHGTRFVVTLDSGRTARVSVSEGVVDLRLQGATAVALRAGDVWERPAIERPAIAVATSVSTSRAAPLSTATLSTASGVPSATFAPAPVTIAASRDDAAAPAAPTTDPFASAMDAFKRGDYAEADSRFAMFQTRSPDDSRVEDAAFLRAVAHNRMGDAAGASRLARQYLDRFPAGLRRAEAERLVGELQ